MTAFFNTGLTQQQFLQQYWQKKPLLIRQAFSDFQSPISPDDLAGLACEPEIESRLIEEKGALGPWQVRSGPLTEDDFARLPSTHWTMLVQDVDKHLPELQSLLDPFRFIPDWRRDDLMVSYAPQHGSVGPHTDGYDVFLLQAMGERRWQINDKAMTDAALIEGLDVQILQEFHPDQSWDLQPGDMLYLPPHIAHHGVALNDCMTFSFGFRAPTKVDMLDAVINAMLERDMGRAHYRDPKLIAAQHAHEISQSAVTEIKQLLHDAIDEADSVITSALGRLVTDTKASLVDLAEQRGSDLATVEDIALLFEQDNVLERNVYYRFAWTADDHAGQLFFAGEAYDLDNVEHLAMLTEKNVLTQIEWLQLNQDEQSVDLLCRLISEGGWFWQSVD
ncbi:cupin [Methylophaga sp. 42_25_T18]|nr:cupin [Methylophaga sp. 42_25_T18]OUR88620.1 cupin [Methylophaga sp. 42_8_T64]